MTFKGDVKRKERYMSTATRCDSFNLWTLCKQRNCCMEHTIYA